MTENPTSTVLDKLAAIAERAGPRITTGLPDDEIVRFAALDPLLTEAVDEAHALWVELVRTDAASLAKPEDQLVAEVQEGLVNFYAPNAVNPYVGLAARGPWVVTAHGAVLHDSGGYGMLGFGHNPAPVMQAMARPQLMANVMTPSFSQRRFVDRLRATLGHTRGGCPFSRFVCLNSGSESMTLSMRLSDVNAGLQTGPSGRHAGEPTKLVSLVGSFHGRTDRPAQLSDSCMPAYRKHLASFRGRDNLVVVPHNDEASLQAAFRRAEEESFFIEAVVVEPVQGEGSPGRALSRAFYDAARQLTAQHGSLLIVDSIQAGLRAHGVLSIVDYPGFQDCEPPDLETWSKALNAGQYPLSVVGVGPRVADLYPHGVYGNTMTTNPRALEVALAVLDLVTPDVRRNIRQRGAELLAALAELQLDFPDLITGVAGTGLLLAAEIRPDIPVVGTDALEARCRHAGLGVIHGGKNALRFTPHFRITGDEIDLMVRRLRAVLASSQS